MNNNLARKYDAIIGLVAALVVAGAFFAPLVFGWFAV